MKKINYLVALAALMISVSFVSCSKNDLAESVEVNKERTATIEGSIVIEENLVPDGNGKTYYAAPKLTQRDFIVTINYSSLTGGAVSSGGKYIVPANNVTYNTETGKFSIIVPVSSTGSDVVISVSDISGTQISLGTPDLKTGTWKGFTRVPIFVLPGQKSTQAKWEMTFVPEVIGGSVIQ